MLDRVRNYVYERRGRIVGAAGVLGGAYVVSGYVSDRIGEMKSGMVRERGARETLRRRFRQTRDDASYTATALMPSLADQLLAELDVDALTAELQARARKRPPISESAPSASASHQQSDSVQLSSSDASSSFHHVSRPSTGEQQALRLPHIRRDPSVVSASASESVSDVESVADYSVSGSSVISGMEGDGSPSLGASTSSWVERMNVSGISAGTGSGAPSSAASEAGDAPEAQNNNGAGDAPRGRTLGVPGQPLEDMTGSQMGASLASSMTSAASSDDAAHGALQGTGVGAGKSKAELWKEVKILTLTRTLTTLYAAVLLAMLTATQHALLARGRYVRAVLADERRERTRARAAQLDAFWGPLIPPIPGAEAGADPFSELHGSGKAGKGKGRLQGSALGRFVSGTGPTGMLVWSAVEGLVGVLSGDLGDSDDEDEGESADEGYEGAAPRRSRGPVSPWETDLGGLEGAFGGFGMGVDGMDVGAGQRENEDDEYDRIEMEYLSLSWWLVHVGWRDIAQRVRWAVEGVFEGVSLKSKLSATDLQGLVDDVRRKVEYTDDGKGRTSFLSALLPQTPEQIARVLAQSGASPPPSSASASGAFPLDASISIDADGSSVSAAPLSDASFSTSPAAPPTAGSSNEPVEGPSPSPSLIPHVTITQPAGIVTPSAVGPAVASVPMQTGEERSNAATPKQQQAKRPIARPSFAALLEQTRGYALGADFARVLEVSAERAVDVLFDGLRAHVFVDSSEKERGVEGENGGEREELKMRLAGLLPGLARWSRLALEGLPNELVDNILAQREVAALEAIIISDYQDRYS
ncbi:hypothetical protein CONPUDRAFT_90911 [Coniophora puteana RWD-64-598 SS2]|uniref:Peroxin-3 n=1 Tax=Coniophora puteana (strain RWD-64-598) TaxID=741705 RepID=A0A5M3MLT0_CONPW|nr:uncharacterized protein CONPUDRAFT_90911 [Coniophora puteana RWD-64-598 SS2]EIW79531.1 hypothetical protein CONPUDRAFT_90911 [Coniophora puteana RWD-64-598 SS2]